MEGDLLLLPLAGLSNQYYREQDESRLVSSSFHGDQVALVLIAAVAEVTGV